MTYFPTIDITGDILSNFSGVVRGATGCVIGAGRYGAMVNGEFLRGRNSRVRLFKRETSADRQAREAYKDALVAPFAYKNMMDWLRNPLKGGAPSMYNDPYSLLAAARRFENGEFGDDTAGREAAAASILAFCQTTDEYE